MLSQQPQANNTPTRSLPDKYVPPRVEPISTYHILQTLHTEHDTLEIQFRGRTLYIAETRRPALGHPRLTLTTSKVDGETIVSAVRMGVNSVGCKVALGGDLKDVRKGEWVEIERTGKGDEKMFVFHYGGEEYAWKRKYDQYTDFPHEDLIFVKTSDSENALAAYLRNRRVVSPQQIARLDVYENLDSDLGLVCLTSVLGVEQGLQARKGNRGGGWFGGSSGIMGLGGIGLAVGGGGGGGGGGG